MDNDSYQTKMTGENTDSKMWAGVGYLILLAILVAALFMGYWLDLFAEIGFVVFLIFYFVSTALVIWFVRTTKTNSLWTDAWKRLFKNKLAVFGLVVVWLMVLLVAIGPSIIFWLTGLAAENIPADGNLIKSFPPFQAPDGAFSWMHPMGTDEAGRDLLARVLQGGRISLMVGIISTAVSLIVGVSYGAVAAYLGGKIDNVMMRIVDIIYSIPYILIVIVLLNVFGGQNTSFLIGLLPFIISLLVTLILLIFLAVFGYRFLIENFDDMSPVTLFGIKTAYVIVAITVLLGGIWANFWLNALAYSRVGQWLSVLYASSVNQGLSQIFLLFFALGLVSWLTMARVVRGQILSLKNQEFVLAARATGVSSIGIIFKHLVPNALGPVIIYATLTVPSVMLTEAFLSFLGLGVQAPYASWGSLAADGIKNISVYPWQLIFPGVTMALTLFSLNFLGDGLRDALDPQTRKF